MKSNIFINLINLIITENLKTTTFHFSITVGNVEQ